MKVRTHNEILFFLGLIMIQSPHLLFVPS